MQEEKGKEEEEREEVIVVVVVEEEGEEADEKGKSFCVSEQGELKEPVGEARYNFFLAKIEIISPPWLYYNIRVILIASYLPFNNYCTC